LNGHKSQENGMGT